MEQPSGNGGSVDETGDESGLRAETIPRHSLGACDGLIAATALANGLHIMTRNVRDFECTGARLINPWPEA